MRIGVAADNGGFALKTQLTSALKAAGHDVVDFGAHELVVGDDYPDFVVPLARAVLLPRIRVPVLVTLVALLTVAVPPLKVVVPV